MTTPIPEDTSASRLRRARDDSDDFARAGDRIAKFWRLHPEGSILTEVETATSLTGEVRYTARSFVRKDGEAERPSATAHATRSTADKDELTAAFAQEAAETASVSRALRNLGILPRGKRS